MSLVRPLWTLELLMQFEKKSPKKYRPLPRERLLRLTAGSPGPLVILKHRHRRLRVLVLNEKVEAKVRIAAIREVGANHRNDGTIDPAVRTQRYLRTWPVQKNYDQSLATRLRARNEKDW